MKIDVKCAEPLIEKYPHLSTYEEFNGSDSKLRFVISLLNEEDEETDMSRRVANAAKIAKIKVVDGILDDKEVEAMMCRYFILLNNDTFELWLSKKIAFGEANFQIRASVREYKDPIKAMSVKMQVSGAAESLRTDILSLERHLFKDEKIEKKIKESIQNRTIHYAELYADSDSVI